MATEGHAADDRVNGAARARSHLFAVRVWKEEVTDGPEYRGSVRDVVSGAFRNFRDWSDLAAFMVARVEGGESDPIEPGEGGRED